MQFVKSIVTGHEDSTHSSSLQIFHGETLSDRKLVRTPNFLSCSFESCGAMCCRFWSCSDTQSETNWKLGKNAIYMEFLGCETTVPVNILPCPYKSVTVNSNPTARVVFGDMNYGSVNEGVYHFTPYDFTGISFTGRERH